MLTRGPLFSLLLILNSFQLVGAIWSWNGQPPALVNPMPLQDRHRRSPTDHQSQSTFSLQDLIQQERFQNTFSIEENAAVFSSLHLLDPSTSKPDCFRSVASSFRVTCSATDRTDVDEDQRTRVAISLTVCDLHSAKLSLPMECVLFDPNERCADRDGSCQKRQEDLQRSARNGCVGAFARSAQMWTSYSGYLREATQLCFALQKVHSVDLARTIYQNITLEKAALLDVLHQEALQTQRRTAYFTSAMQEWKEGLKEFLVSNQNLADVQHSLAQSLSPAALVRGSQKAIEILIQSITTQTEINSDKLSRVALEQIQTSMQATFQDYSCDLSKVVYQTSNFLTEALEKQEAAIERFTNDLATGSQRLTSEMTALESTANRARTGVGELGEALKSTQIGLERSLELVVQTHVASSSALFDVMQASNQIKNLTDELEKQASIVNSTNHLLSTQANGIWRLVFGSKVVLEGAVKVVKLFSRYRSGMDESFVLSILTLPFASSTPLVWSLIKNALNMCFAVIAWLPRHRRSRRVSVHPGLSEFKRIVDVKPVRFVDSGERSNAQRLVVPRRMGGPPLSQPLSQRRIIEPLFPMTRLKDEALSVKHIDPRRIRAKSSPLC